MSQLPLEGSVLAGGEEDVELPVFATPDSFERFRAKTRAFLRDHEAHVAVHKLRMNMALTRADLEDLETMLSARTDDR